MNGDTGNPEFLARIKTSASEVLRLMRAADLESNKILAVLNSLNSRPPQNPIEASQSADEFAVSCNAYAKELNKIIPQFDENISTLTDAYSNYVKSLDLETSEARGELADINKELTGMTAALGSTKEKARTLRDTFHHLSQRNFSPNLNQATYSLVGIIDKLASAYDDLETFGVSISFDVNEKSEQGDTREN